MTNESISGFLNSIAEAKRAFDAEPDYQRQIRDLENDKKRLGDTVAHRELRIHELKQNEETLTQKLRSVEAERDDAGFRALEEADKVQGLLSVVHSIINDALAAVSAVEGYEQIVVNKADRQRELDYANARQERVVELEEELQSLRNDMRLAQEQLAPRPFAMPSDTSFSSGEGTDPSSSRHDMFPEAEYYTKGEGQREVDPTAHHSTGIESQNVASNNANVPSNVSTLEGQSDGPFATQVSTQSENATSTSASKEDSVVSSASPPERNRDRSTFFTGRKYFDVTYFVPLHQWLNEGGSRDDYYWRPAEANVALPEPNRASHQS